MARTGVTTRTRAAPKPVQAQLRVGPVNDRFEREADAVAARVTSPGAETAPVPMVSRLAVQRQPAEKEAKSTENAKALEEIEKEPVQTKPKSRIGTSETASASKEEEKPVQRKVTKAASSITDTSTPVEPKEEEKPAQRDATGGGGGFTVPSGVEASIARQRGRGAPLPGPARDEMEGRFGTDFGGVRVHTGAAAQRAANDLDARAFTVGRDVFFGPGAYDPGSGPGRTLLAHELTHTIQQSGGTAGAPQRVQREGGGSAQNDTNVKDLDKDKDPPSTEFDLKEKGKIEAAPTEKKLTLPSIAIPYIKEGGPKGAKEDGRGIPGAPGADKNGITGAGAWTFKGGIPRAGDQAGRWRKDAAAKFAKSIANAVKAKVEAAEDVPVVRDTHQQPIYYLRQKKSRVLAIGPIEALAVHPMILIPKWGKDGKEVANGNDVDHSQELVLGGEDGWENFWLLNAANNRSAGPKIKSALDKAIGDFLKKVPAEFWKREGVVPKPALEAVEGGSWQVEFRAIVPNGELGGNFWTKGEIKSGKQLETMEVLDRDALTEEGLLRGGKHPETVHFFFKPEGGRSVVVNVAKLEKPVPVNRRESGENFLRGFDLVRIDYQFLEGEIKSGTRTGQLVGVPFRQKKKRGKVIARENGDPDKPVEIPILQSDGLGWGGYLDQSDLRAAISNIEIPGASPVDVTEAGISSDGAITARGFIVSNKLLFPGLRVPVSIVGNDVFVDFPIPTDNLSFGPVSVTEAALQMGLNAETGLFVAGFANVAVDQLGSGSLGARLTRGKTFIEGDFRFDMPFLDNASAALTYNVSEDTLALTLEAAVQAGQLPGIESGNVTATFSRDGVDFTGTMEPSGFLMGSTLTVSYTRETGLGIRADNIALPVENVPGITGATVSLFAQRHPETGEWGFGGLGSADFAIAGVTGGVTVGVDGDIILISGSAGFTKGPATGTLNFTATNQEIDDEGNPIPGEALDEFRVSGRGTASMTFGNILTATAGITLNEQAQIIIDGEIGLPPNFELFARQAYERELVHVEPPEFPIWGVSVGGIGIGIFAFVDAYLNFDAFVGPGSLTEATLGVENLNLDAPENAVVSGTAKFHIPAGAGFTLDIGGGLRARIATAQVSGRVGLDGRLGIEAEANAEVNVRWTQAEGFSLDAFAEAKAHPKFEIGANASVTASVDLLLAEPSHTWGPWRRVLGEFGPEMEVGVKFPVSWSEAEGLSLSLDNLEVTRPEIDFGAVMKDAFLALV
nr:hypothetical protein [uncultured bacterium]